MRKARRVLFKLRKRFFSLSRGKRWLIIAIIMAAIFLLGVTINLLSLNEADLALLELRESFLTEELCHEECSLRRNRLESVIANHLTGASYLDQRMEKYFNSEEEGLEFRKALIKIIYLPKDNAFLPGYLSDYLNYSEGNISLQIEIMSAFPKISFSKMALTTRFKKIISTTNGDSDDKLQALRGLGVMNSGSLSDYYVSLLLSTNSLELKRLAVIMLSNVKYKEQYFSINQLHKIEEIILSTETDKRLRQDLVMLLNSYQVIFPNEVALVLQKVYQEVVDDKISRFFAADFLNTLATWKKYSLPEIEQSEWDYYNY